MAWQQFVIRTRGRLVTTEAVLWEWLNGLSHASNRSVSAEGYRRAHSDASIEVIPFQSGLITSAVRLYASRGDKDWSLTDCLSFVVMEQRQLTQALTTDGHFDQAGFHAVMAAPPPADA